MDVSEASVQCFVRFEKSVGLFAMLLQSVLMRRDARVRPALSTFKRVVLVVVVVGCHRLAWLTIHLQCGVEAAGEYASGTGRGTPAVGVE